MSNFSDLTTTLLEELANALRSVNYEDMDTVKQAILRAERIFIAGQGRSGLQMRAFAMRLMHLGFSVHVVGAITTPSIAQNDLLVIGSGSGRTASLVQHSERTQVLKAQVALITAATSSPLASHADYIVRIAASSSKLEGTDGISSIQLPGSLFEQALGILLDTLIVQLMVDLGISAEQMLARHANLE